MIFLKGDWPYYFPEYLSTFTFPEIWSSVWPTGLGGNQAIILPLKLYLHSVVFLFVNRLGIPWEIIQIIFFLGLFIALSIYSSYKFTKSWIGSLIYTTNTWILLVFFGGQMGIALAYAIAPLVLSQMIKGIKYEVLSIKYVALAALVFPLQVMFDLRVAFLTVLVAIGYSAFYHVFIRRLNLRLLSIHYLLLSIISLLLHAFWILPSIFIAIKGGNVASIVDTSSGSLEFLSFAKFENSLSLLHPNWPENIFGKVSFMRPEFLVLPIIAYSSLLFIGTNGYMAKWLHGHQKSKLTIQPFNHSTILFFATVGLIGAFLAKGTQEPFGVVFSWLYSNVPGFNLFRDPVKFYIFIALSYSLIIPYSLKQIGKFLPAARKVRKAIPIAFIVFWVYLNLPFILNSNVGIFKQRSVPSDYVKLKEFLVQDQNFSRTLWVPNVQRFAFMSNNHPTISYQSLFKSNFVSEFKKSEFQTLLSELSIKYVIIPYDSEGEIFLNDRKYDDKMYRKTVAELDKISWLKRIGEPGTIVIYQISNPKPHTWSKGDKLIFSESFDSNWYAESSGRRVYSKPYGRLNSFDLSPNEHESAILRYEPQKWTTIGYIISAATLLIIATIHIRSRSQLIKGSNKVH